MKEIQLSKQGKSKGKYVALVDDEDYATVNQFRWFASESRRADKTIHTVYAKRHLNKPDGTRTTQYLHRFLMGNTKNVDHEDGNGLNCQRYNLRLATAQQNHRNSRKWDSPTSSKFKGVSRMQGCNRWRAYATIDRKYISGNSQRQTRQPHDH